MAYGLIEIVQHKLDENCLIIVTSIFFLKIRDIIYYLEKVSLYDMFNFLPGEYLWIKYWEIKANTEEMGIIQQDVE